VKDFSRRRLLTRLYQLAPRGAHLGLERMQRAAVQLGHPEREYPAIHVAGTNGKGSVCAFLDSICRSAGVNVGLYTSPHLISITERIRMNGVNIAAETTKLLLSWHDGLTVCWKR